MGAWIIIDYNTRLLLLCSFSLFFTKNPVFLFWIESRKVFDWHYTGTPMASKHHILSCKFTSMVKESARLTVATILCINSLASHIGNLNSLFLKYFVHNNLSIQNLLRHRLKALHVIQYLISIQKKSQKIDKKKLTLLFRVLT